MWRWSVLADGCNSAGYAIKGGNGAGVSVDGRRSARGTLKQMTVCIAAYIPLPPTIVVVSDTMLSNDGLSADGIGIKSTPVDDSSWFAMYAGLPEEFSAVTRRMRATLTGRDNSFDDVLAAAENAYRDEIRRLGDTKYLAPLGMSREEFMASRELIGEAAFTRVFESISAVSLQTQLLICGFDADGGHIASVGMDGLYSIHDTTGFHAIGEGQWLALATLYASPKFRFNVLEPVIYQLYGAKLAAQRARSVGDETVVFVRTMDGSFAFLKDEHLAVAREEWLAATSPPGITKRALVSIREGIVDIERQQQENLRKIAETESRRRGSPADSG
jgi:hypothetical protein